MKTIDSEALLGWAYRDELPKRELAGAGSGEGLLGGGGWAPIEAAGELMTLCGDGRRAQFYAALWRDGPHPDALMVEAAVQGLAGAEPTLHVAPALLLADMPAAVQLEAEAALASWRCDVAALAITCAVLGRRPDWRAEPPKRQAVMAPGGRGHPAWFIAEEVTGPFGGRHSVERQVPIDPRTRRPPKGAYRKWYSEPPVAHLIGGRIDWLVWHAALAALAESLAGRLSAHAVRPPALAAMPWIDGSEDMHRVPRVLPSLVLERAEEPGAPRRSVPLRRARMPRGGPVRRVEGTDGFGAALDIAT